ncbi:MAG: hypothetical protein A3A28_03490 [Candidatus Sungbacteria bacterium RIFCSPLOWO2_01_FULL_47_32]|uniref:Uncharacterized protein n=1 Tax=Candidatus Sungbacteria bacterium RIFCSPHIGHO2_01_FULL_47_32 TaxID=1802264 RepID=A0A1G2K547_9BACT|nr:MAG: hypothetical protein A2633_03570 [Candidatus Sungbacteria bacterium RIFCSPHIGHO2_01_FULL_47_32]OGZ99259.1 MAG: hypothetical protein A3D57_01540 [Candidatus Sungbacteria bacterium RIFCSPHIGHO2_02_FULL_46_12]OHA04999.1 MAG: hypothetical protein A3A28_03490 [Candidatus Sungbacteria bacterium RIFCSPLOWO2_01_FULL_47_32]
MSIEQSPGDKNRVEGVELAQEMASIENATHDFARILAEAIKDPDKRDASKLPSWASGFEVIRSVDLHNMVRVGVTPEDVIAYGEESAEKVENLTKYAENLNGLTKVQLLREYFKQFAEGFMSKMKRDKEYDESKSIITGTVPAMVAQPKEYRDAQRAYENSLEKRTLVWDRVKHGQPE